MEALGIDVKLLIAQLINFGLFIFIFSRFMYKPFMAYIKQQHSEEAERDRLTKELAENELKADVEHKKIIAEARAHALEITQEAETLALEKKHEILAQAETEAQNIKSKARKDIDAERESLYEDVRSKVITTSESMTSAVLRDFFTEKNQKAVMSEIVTKLKSKNVYEN